MDLDQFKLLVGAYYGVESIDEYKLKVYILKEIENCIKDYIVTNKREDFDYKKQASIYEEELSLITKLQNSLIVLNNINAPIELVLIIKQKINDLKDEQNKKYR